MKKRILFTIIITLLVMLIYYYFVLPPINISSMAFWSFVIFSLAVFVGSYILSNLGFITKIHQIKKTSKFISIPILTILIIVAGIFIVNIICSPVFNAKSYSKRIIIDESGEFSTDIAEVNFKNLPLLDRESSEKLGDRVMGQMSDLVSQYYVSNQYTQINYNNDII